MFSSSLAERFDRFLFHPTPAAIYAALRISIGLVCIMELVGKSYDLTLLYSDAGVYPMQGLRILEGSTAGRFSLLFWVTSPGGVEAVRQIGLWASVLYVLGLFTPLCGATVWVVLVSFIQRDYMASDGSDALLANIMFILLFAPCGRVWSIDARIWPAQKERPAWPLALRLIQIQLCIVYFYGALFKLMGAQWLHGETTLYALAIPAIRRFDMDVFLRMPYVAWGFSVFSRVLLLWEATFPVLVWFRRTRPYVLWIGILVHLPQWLTIETNVFAPLMMSCYIAFLSPEAVARWPQTPVRWPVLRAPWKRRVVR